MTAEVVARRWEAGTVLVMEPTPTSAYRLLVHRDGKSVPLAQAIDEVWRGETSPQEFTVTTDPCPLPQQVDLPHEAETIGMAPDTVGSSRSDGP